jgi:hypothetical protein
MKVPNSIWVPDVFTWNEAREKVLEIVQATDWCWVYVGDADGLVACWVACSWNAERAWRQEVGRVVGGLTVSDEEIALRLRDHQTAVKDWKYRGWVDTFHRWIKIFDLEFKLNLSACDLTPVRWLDTLASRNPRRTSHTRPPGSVAVEGFGKLPRSRASPERAKTCRPLSPRPPASPPLRTIVHLQEPDYPTLGLNRKLRSLPDRQG